MKVKVLSRDPEEYFRATKRDIHRIPRNFSPDLHPLEAPREYVRALNATKLERVFAKPFIRSLEGHRDAVHCLCRHPSSLSLVLSGACDGEVILWSVSGKKTVSRVNAHQGFVRGVCISDSLSLAFSAGDDQLLKQWSLTKDGLLGTEPTTVYSTQGPVTSLDCSCDGAHLATGGDTVLLWSPERSEPLRRFEWGNDSHSAVKFSPVERHLVASCSGDRGVVLCDLRGAQPLKKVVLRLRSNAVCWSPTEAFILAVANDDYNVYSFDMRRLDMPLNIHKDHVAAVTCVDFSPTGRELCSGSIDKTVRLFNLAEGHSRDVYHTKRMQRLSAVLWSADDRYVISASDEMNIRLWKARAAEPLSILRWRQREALEYSASLRAKYASHPEIRRIARHRHVPKTIYHARQELHTVRQAAKKKEKNRAAHSKDKKPPVPEKDNVVLEECE